MENSSAVSEALNPLVSDEERRKSEPAQDTLGLCLSGGGYRAMLFHAGALWRLHQLGLLPKLDRISCVSGGAITGGLLGVKWRNIAGAGTTEQVFVDEIVTPLRRLANVTVDTWSVAKGVLLPGPVSDYVARTLAEHLFGDATLQDFPDDPPRIIINAINVQSGSLWRFSKPYMRDYQVGQVLRPALPLAEVVAASSAFPPFLSPAVLNLDEGSFAPSEGEPLHHPPYTTRVVLSDGGVYDNLGLETVWKRCKTILVSDAGRKMPSEEAPQLDWVQHTKRILDLVDNQVRSLRKRQLFAANDAGIRKVAYWGIRSEMAKYPVESALPCPLEQTTELAEIPTRLAALSPELQERLINWGYAICDVALRAWHDRGLPAAQAFPYQH
ncbi:patatin-like phospholipase family protein [Noviherbaspirillum massiliense]|uniref:patatin-like phospholipase family protein n=1 Tax=Noviherbaspirillum massiliense TaxID=1465823 RepID=UPI0002F665A8|nr:patatin-like phospholipase family protein [Noviherbaspirillum massiliense]